MEHQAKKKLLYEVSLIRPFVIILLVVMHSFTKIAAGGVRENDFQLPSLYAWLCHIISGFRIETIALVAGYVFAYQSIVLHKKYEFKPFVVKKAKRLIFPMLFYGIFYYVFFLYEPETFSIGTFFIKWLSGCGHLWFLPMLFWCFLFIWAIDHYHISSWILLLVLALFAILPLPYYKLPLGFARLPHFLFFVYGGFFLFEHRNFLIRYGLSGRFIFSFWLIYVFLVILRQTSLPEKSLNISFIFQKLWDVLISSLDMLISCVGITALYCTICRKIKDAKYTPPNWIINASKYCYGVYVFHQFILVYLYHYTNIVSNVNPYILPWIGLATALSISWCLTGLSLRTRFGRYLIG